VLNLRSIPSFFVVSFHRLEVNMDPLHFVSLVVVCPASSEHTLLLQGYELLIVLSTLSVGGSRSWQRVRSSCAS